MPQRLRFVVALGTAALLVGGCSSSGTSGSKTPADSSSSKEHYLDTVNGLCDDLLPKVIKATHGGSIDISARQYLRDWPAHQKVLVAFDKSLSAVSVPDSASAASTAMGSYIMYADSLDAARLKAARAGEPAWRREVAAEKNAADDPSIAGLTAAGFAESCEAR